MGANSFNVGQSVLTESGERVTITSTSDPTCLTCVTSTGETIPIRRSEIKNPIFKTYQEKIAKLETQYETLHADYLQACSKSKTFAKAITFHCLKKDEILRDAGTVSKFNLSNEERPNFDNHYDLYWENRFSLAASNNNEYNLTRACGDVLLEINNYKSPFGLA